MILAPTSRNEGSKIVSSVDIVWRRPKNILLVNSKKYGLIDVKGLGYDRPRNETEMKAFFNLGLSVPNCL